MQSTERDATGPAPVVVESDEQVEVAVELLVAAFYSDPLWGWAFPDPDVRRMQHRALWRLAVEGAARYPWVWLGGGGAATSVWIPPGGSELSDEQAAAFEPLVRDIAGAGAGRVLGAFELLESARPRTTPHYYLSLLGTDPVQRGHGHGLALLADNLARIDAVGAPAYLEASNGANVALYARYGFEPRATLRPVGGPDVVTMWRAARRA